MKAIYMYCCGDPAKIAQFMHDLTQHGYLRPSMSHLKHLHLDATSELLAPMGLCKIMQYPLGAGARPCTKQHAIAIAQGIRKTVRNIDTVKSL